METRASSPTFDSISEENNMSNTKLTRQSVSVLGILVSIQLTGCAANLTEDEIFEQQYAAVERKEKIREFINACEAKDNVVFYSGPSTHRLRDPFKRIPRHANRSDYQCTSSSAVERMQIEMGLR
jgi:hypothetical protein